ncbi:DUF2806 domain-containing protein [Aestuariivirga sp.]|uniref:DUF2806 domain-containing protein n=1 Tax=Aestuariivirga sp. TaxID=2650926 RepID=UPI003594559A
MSEDGKLVNVNIDLSSLEGLSDAAKILVKRLSNELGAFTRPVHARRLAKAKADIAILEAQTQNKLSEIQERGLRRMVSEEGRHQENIESIATKAIPHIADNAKPAEIEQDWMTEFFEKCRLISNAEMQEIWARLLAKESNTPQSVSKGMSRTLLKMPRLASLVEPYAASAKRSTAWEAGCSVRWF